MGLYANPIVHSPSGRFDQSRHIILYFSRGFGCWSSPLAAIHTRCALSVSRRLNVVITTGGEKPIKISDYISKTVTETVEGHTSNVSFAVYQPILPINAIESNSRDNVLENG